MTVQDTIPTSRPADPVTVHETGDWPRRAGHVTGASPLLAVCGVCGGAGTSTLSYLVARYAVAAARGDVLVCDTGGPAAGLAACARVQSPRSLVEAAAHAARGLSLPGGLYALDDSAGSSGRELRVIATGPRFTDTGNADGLDALLSMARSDGAHALTVVDCGTLQREADRQVLRAASHIAWVLPATGAGVRTGERVLAAIGPILAGRELVVARREARERSAGLRALRALADRRRAPLVLVPHVSGPLGRPDRALDEAAGALEAIVGALRR